MGNVDLFRGRRQVKNAELLVAPFQRCHACLLLEKTGCVNGAFEADGPEDAVDLSLSGLDQAL